MPSDSTRLMFLQVLAPICVCTFRFATIIFLAGCWASSVDGIRVFKDGWLEVLMGTVRNHHVRFFFLGACWRSLLEAIANQNTTSASRHHNMSSDSQVCIASWADAPADEEALWADS